MNIKRRVDQLEARSPSAAPRLKVVLMRPGLSQQDAMAEAGATEADELMFVHFRKVA